MIVNVPRVHAKIKRRPPASRVFDTVDRHLLLRRFFAGQPRRSVVHRINVVPVGVYGLSSPKKENPAVTGGASGLDGLDHAEGRTDGRVRLVLGTVIMPYQRSLVQDHIQCVV